MEGIDDDDAVEEEDVESRSISIHHRHPLHHKLTIFASSNICPKSRKRLQEKPEGEHVWKRLNLIPSETKNSKNSQVNCTVNDFHKAIYSYVQEFLCICIPMCMHSYVSAFLSALISTC